MKKLFKIFFILIFIIAYGMVYPEIKISVKKITGKVIILQAEGLSDHNITAFDSEKGIIIVDTDVSPVLARAVRSKIEEIFGKKKFIYVINTHAHGDHTYGNQEYTDALIVGHENCLKEMSGFNEDAERDSKQFPAIIDRLSERLNKMEAGTTEYISLKNTIDSYKVYLEGISNGFISTPPSVTFSDKLNLDCGDLTFELTWFGNAHSKSDILIYCPGENILLTGDLFIPKMNPPYLNSDNYKELGNWINHLEKYFGSGDKNILVIPGHDNGLTAADMNELFAYLKHESGRIAGKENAFTFFNMEKEKSGTEAGIAKLEALIQFTDKYFILEGDLVSAGYNSLYWEKDTACAVQLFEILAKQFPDSWNAFDCLGEAYMTANNIEKSIDCYKKSLELNPQNSNASEKIDRLMSIMNENM